MTTEETHMTNAKIGAFVFMRKGTTPKCFVTLPVAAVLSVTFLMLAGNSKSYANYAYEACHKSWSSCTQRCGRLYVGAFLKSCLTRCDGGLNRCLDNLENPGKTETPPDPIRPKGTGNHTPPVGGTKGVPFNPKSTGDHVRPGGGVSNGHSTGAGSGGPIILRSNGGGSGGGGSIGGGAIFHKSGGGGGGLR